jgi:hypothetical protein
MVANMVEMERSYLTAEVFREILASSHAIDELSEEVHVRLLSSIPRTAVWSHAFSANPMLTCPTLVGSCLLVSWGGDQNARRIRG